MLERLPDEVIAIVLETVPPKQLVILRLCCRWLDRLVRTSSLAMYRIECWAAGVYDDSAAGLPYADRRALLHCRERAWRQLDCRKEIHVEVPFETRGTFDLSDGFLVLGRECTQSPFVVSALDLNAVCDRSDPMEQSWQNYAFDDQVVDYGLAIGSLDLITVVTTVPEEGWAAGDEESPIPHSFDLHLIAASTGNAHPLASVPTVHLCSGHAIMEKPTVLTEVVGDWILAYIYNRYATRDDSVTDALYFVNWKTGKSELLKTLNSNIYQGMAVLSQDLVMFPNMITFTIDVYLFSENAFGSVSFIQQRYLELPAHRPGLTLTECYCQAKPSLHAQGYASTASAPQSRPFCDRPEDAIVVFTFEFDDDDEAASLIVHRSTILDAFSTSLRASDTKEYSIPYERWAAGRCFWLSHLVDWFGQPAGQRFAWPNEAREEGASSRLCSVWDFNPYSVFRMLRASKDDKDEEESPNETTLGVRYGRDLWLKVSIFDKPVQCGLPYVQTTFKASEPVGGFILDDYRLLAIESREPWQWGSVMSGFTMKVFA